MHYRYALQRNNNIPDHYREKMQKFFGDSLQNLYDNHLIEKDCIKSSAGLSNFLTKLVDFSLLTRKRDRYGKYIYQASPLIFSEFNRIEVKEHIDMYPIDAINNIVHIIGQPSIKIKTPHEIGSLGCFFGLPTEVDFGGYYTSEEIKTIKSSISNIYTNLAKINNIKYKYTKDYQKGQSAVSILFDI
jgi:hypothetical protein